VHLGWEVEVELSLKDGPEVTAYLTREHLDQLRLQSQQRVYIKPRKQRLSHWLPELEVLGALLANIYLIDLRRQVNQLKQTAKSQPQQGHQFFGVRSLVASQVYLVYLGWWGHYSRSLQILLFGETMQIAIQKSLGLFSLINVSLYWSYSER